MNNKDDSCPVLTGKEHNFNKYEDDFITDLNTPYDYESIMHYRPLSFNKNESFPTITTTIPYFNGVIGQRMDFSEVDITRLNRMYDCGEFPPGTSWFPYMQITLTCEQLTHSTHSFWASNAICLGERHNFKYKKCNICQLPQCFSHKQFKRELRPHAEGLY